MVSNAGLGAPSAAREMWSADLLYQKDGPVTADITHLENLGILPSFSQALELCLQHAGITPKVGTDVAAFFTATAGEDEATEFRWRPGRNGYRVALVHAVIPPPVLGTGLGRVGDAIVLPLGPAGVVFLNQTAHIQLSRVTRWHAEYGTKAEQAGERQLTFHSVTHVLTIRDSDFDGTGEGVITDALARLAAAGIVLQELDLRMDNPAPNEDEPLPF